VSLFSSVIGAAVGAYWGVDSGLEVNRKTQVEDRERLVQALLSETNDNQLILKGAITEEIWTLTSMSPSRPNSVVSSEALSQGIFFSDDVDPELRQGLTVYIANVNAANLTMNLLEQQFTQYGKITPDDLEWFDSVARSCLTVTYVLQSHLRDYMKRNGIEEKADVEASKRYFDECKQMAKRVNDEIKRKSAQSTPSK
jgi:hypothetical protein